jgi:hypothetical protein
MVEQALLAVPANRLAGLTTFDGTHARSRAPAAERDPWQSLALMRKRGVLPAIRGSAADRELRTVV